MKTQQWMLQKKNGDVLGPFVTAQILSLIRDGEVQGEELVRAVPGGKWLKISRQPEFFDQLLSVLENPKQASDSAAVFMAEKKTLLNESDLEATRAEVAAPSQLPPSPSQTVLELEDLNKIQKKTSSSLLGLGLLLGSVVAIAIGLAFVLKPGKSHDDRTRLVLPNLKNPPSLPIEEQNRLLAKALKLYLADQFESNLQAQTQLVSLLEGGSNNLDARGMLCLVYKELWPFSRQDSQDIEAIQVVTQTTRLLDPAGLPGLTCQIALFQVLGKSKEARGILDYALNQPAFSSTAHLFQMKSELLALDKDFATAALYVEKATQLWPTWIKAMIQLGVYFTKANQTDKATQAYSQALKLNPTHRRGLLEYGALLLEKLSSPQNALEYLISASQNKSKLTRTEDVRNYFLLAKTYRLLAQNREALVYGEKAFKLNPSNKEIRNFLIDIGGSIDVEKGIEANNELVLLGDQYVRSGDCLSAQAEFKAAFELDPTNALAALKAGRCLWQLNLSQEAIVWVNKAVQADAKLAMAYYVLADYYSQRYNFTAANQILNRGAQQMLQHYEILRGYGLVEFRRNSFQGAIQFLQRALKIYPNDVETLLLLARASSGAKDFQAAQAYALRAIELDGSHVEAQIVYAEVLSQFKGTDAGVFYLRELIGRFSFTPEYRLALADMNRLADRHRQAVEVYEQLLQLDPRNKKALMGLAMSLQNQGLVDRSLKTFFDAAVLDPSDAEPLMRAGLVYLEAGKMKEAITQLQRGLKLNVNYPLGNYYIGKAAFLSGQYDIALEAAMNERKLNPQLPEAYTLAAEVYTARRDYVKCTQEYQQVLKLQAKGADKYIKIARCYRLSGSTDIAESMLNLAISEESGKAEIYLEQGAVFELKGDKRAAVEAYNKYLTLSPNAPDKKEVEMKITSLGGVVIN